MADVQLEHGYLQIANRLYEAVLQADFRDAHLRIVLALIRVTYGWRQRTVQLPSEAQLARYARLEPNAGGFRTALRELIQAGVILSYRNGTMGLRKDYTRWGRFSVAEARIEAVFADRPEAGIVPDTAPAVSAPKQADHPRRDEPRQDDPHPRQDDPHPRQDDPHPRQDDGGVVSPSSVRLTTAERQLKTLKDKSTGNAREIACDLVVSANQGLAEHPTAPQPIPRIVATSGSSHAAAEAILLAGVPLAFAKSHIYELARSHTADGPVCSLKYFAAAVIRRWQQDEAASDAERADRPLAVAPRRGGESGADPDVWKRAAAEIEASEAGEAGEEAAHANGARRAKHVTPAKPRNTHA
jgi:phage replication O-like protein O